MGAEMAELEWRIKMEDLSENLQGILREHDDEGIGAAANLYDRIDRIFGFFASGRGYAAGRMKNHLRSVREELLKDKEEEFGGAKEDLDGWQGEAAAQFANYLNQLNDGVNLMEYRIDALLMILEAHERLVGNMRRDGMELVRHTLDGIDAAETAGWKVGAQVVGAVAGVVGTIAGAAAGGPAGPLLAQIAGSMVAGAVSVIVEAKEADSELGVIVEFVNSGEGLIDQIAIERECIERGFRDLAARFTGESLPEVRPDRPLIVTAPDFRPESFGLPDQVQGGHPVPTNTSDVLPEPPKHQDGPFDRTKKGNDRYPEQGPA